MIGIIYRLIIFFIALGVIILAGVFAAGNAEPLELVFPFIKQGIMLPAYLWHLFTFCLGGIFAAMFFFWDSLRKSLTIRKLKKQLKKKSVDLEVEKQIMVSSFTPKSEIYGQNK